MPEASPHGVRAAQRAPPGVDLRKILGIMARAVQPGAARFPCFISRARPGTYIQVKKFQLSGEQT
ncbi:MAG TPA: hypothetical protein VD835_17185 [Pyrinomonadaceae bacterium]|nr:hypothetical protein [Pyrinomonadaceae bacterium]